MQTSIPSSIFRQVRAVLISSPACPALPQNRTALFSFYRDATSIPLPVYGGICHAPHIYSNGDATAIIHGGVEPIAGESLAVSPLHSTSTGAPYEANHG